MHGNTQKARAACLPLLTGLLLFLPAQLGAAGSDLSVIRLPVAEPKLPRGELGWHCDSLLRSDFSRFRGAGCRDKRSESSGKSLPLDQPPQLGSHPDA